MSGQRVVVTGLGQVSSLGTDLLTFSEGVFAGRAGVERLEGLSVPGLDDPIGARVPAFEPLAWLPARVLPTTARVAQYAYAAAAQAFEAAGLGREERPRGGVFLGSGFGAIAETEETYRACFTRPGARPRPTVIPTAMANAAAALLAAEFRLRGPNLTLLVACASASHAIGQAFHLLREGKADVMLAGGAEAPLTPIVIAAWNAMRVLAPAGNDPAQACRPFRQDRQGLVIGEGAAFLLLETLDHAQARGAPMLAEILGYGANADAGHITHPDPEGIRACMVAALADAQLGAKAVGYINAHGTGTSVNDRVEAEAIAALFGAHAPPLSSTKAVHGHAMGASGALEAVATILALREQRLPPTANLGMADPGLPALDYVTVARRATFRAAVSNSFAFGGNNAVLVFGRGD